MKRINAFDGLRGLAILLVIINHIPIENWLLALPDFFSNLRPLIQNNGKTGVSILFMMTGFLMAYLYPEVKNKIDFFGKRYSRLLPPFLTMVLSLGIINLVRLYYVKLPILAEISIVVLFSIICKFILEKYNSLFEKNNSKSISRLLTISFLSLQVITMFWYIFYLQNIPPSIFYQNWSQTSQLLTNILVNATFTLPFGRYVAQIDGVYWALIVEVFFYILYPIFFIPLLKICKKVKSNTIKLLLLISTLPFSFGLKIIADRILGFDMLQLHLVIYLIFGVIIGDYLKFDKHQNSSSDNSVKISKLPSFLLSKFTLFSIMFLSLFAVYVYRFIPNFYHPIVHLLLVFPIGLLFLILGSNYSKWSNYFDKPILNWFGKYSYAIYLVHSSVIYWTQRSIIVIDENRTVNSIMITIISFIFSLLLGVFLYKMTEEPYIKNKTKKNIQKSMDMTKSKDLTKTKTSNSTYFILFLISIIFLLFVSFKPPLAFFTSSERHFDRLEDIDDQLEEITTQPVSIGFTASQNNLGNITTNIKKLKIEDSTFVTPESVQIVITLYDENHKLIANSAYSAVQINNDKYHPFGFPLQTESKDKKYFLEYRLSQPDPAYSIMIDKTDGVFVKVYFLDKKNLIKNPTEFLSFLVDKLLEPTKIKFFWITLLYISPFIFLVTYAYIADTRIKK